MNNFTVIAVLHICQYLALLSLSTHFSHCGVSLCLSQEKQERAIGLLVSLGPQPGSEVTPWYMKTGKEKEEAKEKEERKDPEEKKGISEEEKEKRDRRLKDSLDPLKEMKKIMAVKDRKYNNKKKERRAKGEKWSSGER